MNTKLALLCLAALPAQAAPITWTAYDITPNASDVSTAGTVVDARSGGGSDVTVNGVTFLSVANSGNLFDSWFATDAIGARGHGNSYVTDASYRSLLGTGQRSGRFGFGDPRIEPTENWTTINFSGLTIGNTYQIQIWTSDGNFANPTSDGLIQTTALVLGDGGAGSPVFGTDPHIFYELFDNQTSQYGGTGQYALGTFVADATTQSVNVRKYNNTHTTPVATNGDHFSNGWQIRDLGVVGPDETPPTPDPMTWASVPAALGDSSITMTASTATDDNGVEYQFKRYASDGTSLLFTSPWQDDPTFTDTGLTANTIYGYTVTARDKSANLNETAPSTPVALATTDPADETAPSPDPMTFAAVPSADGPYSISMTATTATDDSGVEYQFKRYASNGTTLLFTSPWQDSTAYTDTGLSPNTTYSYTVTARDKSTAQNTTDPSGSVSATTEDIDNIAPTPNPMTFAVAPAAVSSGAITMTADAASDPSGVEYQFKRYASNGTTLLFTSPWQDSPTYTDTGLSPDTQYAYTVTARDKGPLQNATAASSAASATTDPTAIITWTAHYITNSVTDISNNGTLVDARAGANSSQLVNGVVFESVANSGNLFDSLFANDVIGNRGYGSLVTKLSYQTLLKLGQRSGRPDWNEPPRIAPTQNWATVNFAGLTVGNLYEIQIWSSDVGLSPDGIAQNSALVLGNGSAGAPVFGTDTQLFLEATDYGAGQYGTGTFVAVAPTQSFNVQQYNNLNSTPSAKTTDHWSNGWQIRDLGPSVSDFDLWAGNYPGLGAAGDDDDGDGLTNEKERVFGLDPQDGASANAYAVPFNPASGAFSYTRRTQSLTGLDYKVWYSTDLEQWFEDTGAVEGVPTAHPQRSNVEIVPVQVSISLLAQPRLFVQLSAGETVLPPPAPRLASLWGSGSTVTLNFTEVMDETSATNPANYAVTGGTVTGASLSPDGRTVTLTLDSPLAIGSAYDVTLGNLTGGGGDPLGGSNTGQFVNWDNEPSGIKVFILAGQSNMVGYGYSEVGGNPAWTPENGEPKELLGGPGSLRFLAKNNGLYPEYDYTSLLVNPSDTDSAWRTRPDVKVWWEQGVSGNLGGAEGYGDLGPPFRGGSTEWFGPEYGFGQVIGDFYSGPNEAPVLIIKAAWGGHSLGGNFRPPSAVADRGGVVGASYNETFDNARFILNNLAARFPAAQNPEFDAVGYRYQIVGFALHQGYTDRVAANLSPEYQDNLPDFIHDVRGAFGKPEMPFVIASTGMDTTFVEASPYPNYSEVEQAQLWVIGEPQPANVLSSDTRSFMEAAVDSPRNQGFHWHGNARSYFRIGLGLGNHMVTLLAP